MYKAMDIAQYIINYAIQLGKPVSNLKLQKLLYYVQAALLLESEDSCIVEEIYNWRHGPVIEDVYREYKTYGSRAIENIQRGYSSYEFDDDLNFVKKEYDFKTQENNISEIDKTIIKDVVDSQIKYDPWTLVDRTHAEDPWKNTTTNQIIEKESIKEYFRNKQQRIYGE
ncbi:MAG: DUF4065 domain-containing protein [Clostridium celatum]|nr:DUF4065 domain-containing protein [Clostridium celatum]